MKTRIKLFATVLIVLLFFTNCVKRVDNGKNKQTKKIKFGIVLHGGAGNITPQNLPPERAEQYRTKLKEALLTGYNILKNGGSSLDAVESAIKVLENSPLFNAAKGAVMTDVGTCELDASIMDGSNINAGAVAGVKHIKNPIVAARKVMELSPHVLLAGDGADTFAKEIGLRTVPNSYFYTPRRLKQFKKYKAQKKQTSANENSSFKKFGTVGCVALDIHGNLAAGTSTGGIPFKKFGRIGDSPIIGAGTYANNQTCAISCTGQGEYFIRNVVAYDISALMEYKNLSLKEAATRVIMKKLVKQKAEGGMIGIDRNGNIVTVFNSPGMFRAWATDSQSPVIKMFKTNN